MSCPTCLGRKWMPCPLCLQCPEQPRSSEGFLVPGLCLRLKSGQARIGREARSPCPACWGRGQPSRLWRAAQAAADRACALTELSAPTDTRGVSPRLSTQYGSELLRVELSNQPKSICFISPKGLFKEMVIEVEMVAVKGWFWKEWIYDLFSTLLVFRTDLKIHLLFLFPLQCMQGTPCTFV